MQLQRNFRVMRRHNLFSSIWCLISWSSISGTSYFTLPGDPSIHPIQSTNSTMVLHPSLSRIIWLHFRKYYQLDIRKDAALGPRVVWARERAKDAGYSVIIIIGFGLLVGAFYSLFRLYIWSSSWFRLLFLLSGICSPPTARRYCSTKLWPIVSHMEGWQVFSGNQSKPLVSRLL